MFLSKITMLIVNLWLFIFKLLINNSIFLRISVCTTSRAWWDTIVDAWSWLYLRFVNLIFLSVMVSWWLSASSCLRSFKQRIRRVLIEFLAISKHTTIRLFIKVKFKYRINNIVFLYSSKNWEFNKVQRIWV